MAGLLDSYINSLLAAGNGNTGFMRPATAYNAQASLLNNPQQAAPASNNSGILGQLLGGLKGADYSNLGPTLLNLGAGIAAGSGEGWGPGIGKGLALASEAQQNAESRKQKELAQALQLTMLQNTIQNQKFNQELGLANLGIRQQGAGLEAQRVAQTEKSQEEQRNLQRSKWAAPLGLITGNIPKYAAAKSTLVNADFWSRLRGSTTNTGEFAKALLPVKQMITGLANLQSVPQKDLEATMLPTSADDVAEKLGNLETALQGLSSTVSDTELQGQINRTITPEALNPAKPGIPTQYPPAPPRQGEAQAGVTGAGTGTDWQTNAAARTPDQVYTLPNGQKAYWRVFPTGQQGWEPVQ